ncbi:MAG: hypothetical protein WCC69_11790 [Pirellulales bacterium]
MFVQYGLLEMIAAQSMSFPGSGRGDGGGGGMIGGGGGTDLGSIRGLRGLGAYGDVSEAVKKFQRKYNLLQPDIEDATPVAHYYPLGRADGIWGGNTNYAFWGYAEYRESQDGCVGASGLGTDVRNGGPRICKACLNADGFSDAEVEELQRAWADYRAYDRTNPGVDPTVPPPLLPPTNGNGNGNGTEKKGSVWPWVLGGAALLGLGVILWKSKKR